MFRPLALMAVALLTSAAFPALAADTPAPADAAAAPTTEKVDTTLKAEEPAKVEETAPVKEVTPPPAAEPKVVEAKAPAKAAPAVNEGDAMKNKILYVVQHALMGGGVAVVVLQALAIAVTGVVLYLMPRAYSGDNPTAMERMIPFEWRRAVSTGILVGVLPGLLMLAVCGGIATAISAVRNVDAFKGN
jgi:hypothetical protein